MPAESLTLGVTGQLTSPQFPYLPTTEVDWSALPAGLVCSPQMSPILSSRNRHLKTSTRVLVGMWATETQLRKYTDERACVTRSRAAEPVRGAVMRPPDGGPLRRLRGRLCDMATCLGGRASQAWA